MDRYKNKYRIQSTRLQNWDYGWTGSNFITICTLDKKCYFGDVVNGKMKLSECGILADVLWYEIKNHSYNIEMGKFVVMPNHIHGILILNNNENFAGSNTNLIVVETRHALSLRQKPSYKTEQTIGQKRFQNQGNNTISSIVGSYKSAVTKHTHRLGFEFEWQPRFYDHIIRNKKSFKTISSYIINNPLKWDVDKFYDIQG